MIRVFTPSSKGKIEVNLERLSKDKFFWCNCDNPSDKELKKISKSAGINFEDLKLKDYKKDSKIIFKEDYDVLLLKYPLLKVEKVSLSNIIIIFNKKFVVTVYNGKIGFINEFCNNIKNELFAVKNIDYFFFLRKVLGFVINQFLQVLDSIELKLERAEDDILKPTTNVKNLLFVKKNLLYTRKALVSNRNVIAELQEGASKYILPNKILEVYNDTNHVFGIEELFRDRLTGIFELYLSSMSNKLNDIMKSFTVIASLLLIPMLVSGIYGMNVQLPLGNNPNAFYTIMFIILVLTVLTLLYFKIKRWV